MKGADIDISLLSGGIGHGKGVELKWNVGCEVLQKSHRRYEFVSTEGLEVGIEDAINLPACALAPTSVVLC